MRNHRNARKEFNSMIAAYGEIDRDYIYIDLIYIEQNRKKAKYNRLISCLKYLTGHVPEFKEILAGAPWEVPYVSYRHVANDLFKVVEYMCQNSGASYLVKVRDMHEMSVRFVATTSLNPTDIRNTIIKNFGLEDYNICPGRCGSRKKY